MERYKVLGAVLALKEFTVADLALFSGVKPNTIRTVLSREPELLDEIGKRESGSKGGQFTKYRLRSDTIGRLRSEIRELYREFGTYVAHEMSGEKALECNAPLPILTAEDALVRRFLKTSKTSAKIELIEFARTILMQQYTRVQESQQSVNEHLEFHLLSLRALIDLCSAELVVGEKPHLSGYPASVLRDFFFSLTERGSRLGELDRCNILLNRFLLSSVLHMTAEPRFVLNKETSLVSALQSQATEGASEFAECLNDLSQRAQEMALANKESVKRLHDNLDAVQSAAIGTAFGHGTASGTVPLSIGIETLGGIVTRIIPRNTLLPTKTREVFSTAQDNQTSVQVALYQGERALARDNRRFGTFYLSGISPAPRGVPQIEVRFEVDLGGKLTVTATDLQTGNHQEIGLAVAPELSQPEIENMIRDAEDHLAADREEQRKVEVRLRAESLISNLEKSLLEHGSEIPSALNTEVETAIRGSKDAINESTAEQMEAAIQKLTNLYERLFSFVNAKVKEAPESLAIPQSSAVSSRNREKVRG